MSLVETNAGHPNSHSNGLPDRFYLAVVRDYIAANWADFTVYTKACEVDPELVYQHLSTNSKESR